MLFAHAKVGQPHYIDQEAVLLKSLEVVDKEGVHQIIKLRDPLMLPPPQAAPG